MKALSMALMADLPGGSRSGRIVVWLCRRRVDSARKTSWVRRIEVGGRATRPDGGWIGRPRRAIIARRPGWRRGSRWRSVGHRLTEWITRRHRRRIVPPWRTRRIGGGSRGRAGGCLVQRSGLGGQSSRWIDRRLLGRPRHRAVVLRLTGGGLQDWS